MVERTARLFFQLDGEEQVVEEAIHISMNKTSGRR